MKNEFSSPVDLYDKDYYDYHLGSIPYDRDQPLWNAHFKTLAETIIARFQPARVMDIGCAKGFLVEHLRDSGVEAYGIDISSYAISEVRTDIKPYCRVISAAEPLQEQYDLITFIEVAEHLSEEEARQTIKQICLHTNKVLFSSTPDDFTEPTHINVQPPHYWLAIFAEQGFYPDINFDPDFIAPHAVFFRRIEKEVNQFDNLPLVSLCIPTFNGEEFIAETLCSALSQTYPYIQILVSDDSSTDRTLEIVKFFQNNNNSVEFLIIQHQRYGLAGNWNFCISQAKGKYIKFLMQDDLLEPECIEKMVNLAEQDDEVGLVFSPRDMIMSKSAESDPASQFVYEGCRDLHKAWTKLKPIQSSQELLADPKFLDTPPLNKIGEPSTVLIRKDVFERLSNFDPQLQQLIDLDMWFRIIGNYKIGFVNKTLSYFRIHPRQASRTNFTNGESSKDSQRFYTKMLSSSEYSFLSAAHKHLISNRLAHIHNWQLQLQQLTEKNLCSVTYPVIDSVRQKTDRPLWSVIIPTYNPNLEYLEKTLRSVLAQDLGCEEMQIEVVDDRSTQNDPEELVKRIGQGRVSFYRHPKNLGLIGNWNACIERARGHLVHILHQDDVVKLGFYSRLQAAFEQEPTIGAAFCRYFYMDEKGCERDLSLLERETPGVIPNWIERIAVTQRIECPSIVVKREVYEKLGGFCREAHYAADWEMWKRIAAHYSVWYEPELLASYRSHSSSESSRLIKSGANIADTLKAIEISQSYLPVTISAELSNQARENCAFKALHIARQMLSKGDVDAAIAQLREGIKSSQSSNTLVSVLELVQEIVRDSYQYNLLPIDALTLFLSAFQEPLQKQEAIALIESLKLRETNLIIFPDWSQPEDLIYQDLASVITSLMNHPDINQTTLLIDRGNLAEDEATLFISGVVMNLVMEEGLDVADELEISLVGQLNEMQWEVLSPRINARIVLEHENQQAIAQSKVEKIPTYEIPSFGELTSILT